MNAFPSPYALLGEPVVQQVAWALVHSLWQGLVVAALLAAALRVLRDRSAAARYVACCAALVLFAVSPLLTFVILNGPVRTVATRPHDDRGTRAEDPESGPSPAPLISSPTDAPPSPASEPAPEQMPQVTPIARAPRLAASPDSVFAWIVGAWFLGVAAMSVRHVGGWVRVQHVRRIGTRPLGPACDHTLANLCRRLGITRRVRLLESALVQVPTVIGWLRPVVLVPASAVAGLPPHQLEAILAHELAHVRRHDYLVNLLQVVVETLLFYHPAAWWISSRTRLEREDCCDDLASEFCGGVAPYGRALAAMEGLRDLAPGGAAPALPFALAADGGAGSLLRRIRRLAARGAPAASPKARSLAGATAVAAVVSLALPLAVIGVQRPDRPVRANPSNRSASTGANEPTRKDAAVPSVSVEKDVRDADDAPRTAALRMELTRLVDEGIKISRELIQAKNKLSNLQVLNGAGQDPPELEEKLGNDTAYLGMVRQCRQLASDLPTAPSDAEPPQLIAQKKRLAALLQKLDDHRLETKNALFASLAAASRSDIERNEKRLRDVKERITRVGNELTRVESDPQDRAAGGAKADAPAKRELTVQNIARIDSTMLKKVEARERVAAELSEARLTLADGHPRVTLLKRRLKDQDAEIEQHAREFNQRWMPNLLAQPEPTPPAAGPAGGGPAPAEEQYFISGVPRAGAHPLGTRPLNLLKALIAGGLDVDASRGRQVMLLRPGEGGKDGAPPREVVTTLTVGELVDRRDLYLSPDDIVIVKAAGAPPVQPPAAGGATAPGTDGPAKAGQPEDTEALEQLRR